MTVGFYETDAGVEQYLLFHYGTPEQICPLLPEARIACGFPVRCVSESLRGITLGKHDRALDLGCAVGGSSFELRRHFDEVIGIDFSRRFIAAAQQMQQEHCTIVHAHREGKVHDEFPLKLPPDVATDRIYFEQGDACALRSDLGKFDLILMANLIDRLPDPAGCLAHLPDMIHSQGWLIITSPYTWMEEYTPRTRWLDDDGLGTLGTLKKILAPAFDLRRIFDLTFLIREHRRKYQWSIAEATLWQRR